MLLLAGYAGHDALRGRFPTAPKFVVPVLSATALACAILNLRIEYLVVAFAAAFALGWGLRLPAVGEAPARAKWDVGAGLAFVTGVVAIAFAWSEALLSRVFLAALLLVALRVAVIDPILALRSR